MFLTAVSSLFRNLLGGVRSAGISRAASRGLCLIEYSANQSFCRLHDVSVEYF
jgi:hypothetical protein